MPILLHMLLILFQILLPWAGADIDFQMEGLARSYPLGGTWGLEVGYGQTLWGTAPHDGGRGKDSPWYGYIRPALGFKNAGQYWSATMKFEFYPVSIFGVTVGAEGVTNGSPYKAFDCETYQCTGRTWRTFVEGQTVIGMGPWFLLGRARVEDWHQEKTFTKNFIEPNSGLAAKSDGDQLKSITGATGWKIDDHWTVLYSFLWSEMKNQTGQSQTHLGVLSWQTEDWRWSIGGGTFHSELKRLSATAVLHVEWRPLPSVSYF